MNARLAAYADKGRFETNLHWLWEQAGDLIEEVSRTTLGEQAVAYEQERFTRKVDAEWVRNVAEYGLAMHVSRGQRAAVHRRPRRSLEGAAAPLRRALRRVTEDRIRALDTCSGRKASATTSFSLRSRFSKPMRPPSGAAAKASQFEQRVADLFRASAEQSKALTDRTRSTASSARGMLGKTSEVAAAAEQSAVAMREAAQTAAGLIRAIEDARSEVEVAAGVAVRAGEQAIQAVKVSQALSAHVEAIESILSA